MDLDKYFKKYVWDDERTPYFVPVSRLTRRQAGYEILFYALFVGVLCAGISLVSLSNKLPHGGAAIVSIYAFTVVCAALLLGMSRHPSAALWCTSPPLAALAYFAVYGFHPNLGPTDKVLLVVVMIAWVAYARRLLAIARAYASLPDTPGPA
jgi:drug/metabolite transporter (DMT)-like permease